MKKNSLMNQFIFFILIVSILPLISVGALSYYISSSVIKEQADAYTSRFMQDQKDYMEIIMGEVESLIENISSIDEIKDAVSRKEKEQDDYKKLTTQAKISSILNGYTHLEGLVSIDIFAADSIHFHVGDTLNVQSINKEVRNKIYKKVSPLNDVAWIGVEDNINHNSLDTKNIVAAKALKTVNPDTLKGRTDGLLIVNYSIDQFYNYFINQYNGEETYMMIIDQENRLVFFPDKEKIGSVLPVEFTQELNKSHGSFTEYINGRRMLVTYTKSDMSHWILVNLIPVELLVEKAEHIRNSTLIISGICLFFILFASLWVSQKVVRPIKNITDLFKKIQEDSIDLDFRLPERIHDEIGELTRWFNTFLDSLTEKKHVEEELLKAHSKMEQKVRERTEELAAMNKTLIEEITSREKSEKELMYLSFHDSLTGIKNRASFEQEMQCLRKKHYGDCAIIICDVDGLKLVNDSMGHNSGDLLLIQTAEILKECIQKNDLLARIGGDEFAIIVYSNKKAVSREIIDKIRDRIQKYNRKNPQLPLSISLGFAVCSGSNSNVDDVFKEADNNMYREKLYQGNSARSAIVRTMMKAMEERDLITEGHAERVQTYVVRLGKKLGFSESRLTKLRLFAQFHDIGKVGIKDRILFKKGDLTVEEKAEMNRHSEIGYRIAQSAQDLVPIADWILKHHEWWNGDGYPLNIKEEEIPLECRMLSIADAYDAMTSVRPYRKIMTHEEAVKELVNSSGIQFDPNIVSLFIQCFKE